MCFAGMLYLLMGQIASVWDCVSILALSLLRLVVGGDIELPPQLRNSEE